MTNANAMGSQNITEPEELQRAFMAATKPRSLHELVDELLAIMTDVDAAEGEVSADQDARLAALDLSLEQKVEGYAAVCERMDAEAEALKTLAQRYTAKAKLREAARERLRDRLQLEMQRAGRDAIKTATASARIQASSDHVELELEDEYALIFQYEVPPEFVTRPPAKINRKAVIAALKSGRELAWAWLEKSSHLRFR
jgi:hypothetical protein